MLPVLPGTDPDAILPTGADPMRLALYQPDIPQNTGTILRMAACLGVAVDVIGPAGFDMSDRALRRAGLDYLAHATLRRHVSFADFEAWRRGLPCGADCAHDAGGGHATAAAVGGGCRARGSGTTMPRLVLLTTHAATAHLDFAFRASDILLLGRESAGVPDDVHRRADARIAVPMRPGLRSLNVAVAAAIVLGEALRQTGGWPSRPASAT